MAVARNRKGIIRAILAGGIVLGVGAAVTLAAWNASEFATGTFQAGTFTIEGATQIGMASPCLTRLGLPGVTSAQ